MNLLNKLTIKSLKLNKKRTIVTIIGIILSVALICAVATMYASGIKSLINYEKYQYGDFHISYENVPVSNLKDFSYNQKIANINLTQNIGYAKITTKNEFKPYAYIKAFTPDSLNNLAVRLVEGRLPTNDQEILIPTHLKTNGRLTINLGDTISLDVGKRVSENVELTQNNPYIKDNENITDVVAKTYKVVGIIERPATNIESYNAPGYTFITYLDQNKLKGNVDVYAKYTKAGIKQIYKVTANILGIDESLFKKVNEGQSLSETELQQYDQEIKKSKYQINMNSYLIELQTNPIKSSGISGLGTVIVIVCLIIVITSIFCIKNSFDISITEKIKQYGMLRSIGATKKQIIKNVFYEAIILGLIAIPLGIIGGLFASYILVIVCNYFLKGMLDSGLKLVFAFSPISIIVAIILGIITIYFSAFRSAHKASKINPIDSIRNSANIKLKAKKLKSPKLINKIFGIGGDISYKNMKRNKKKYRTTVISIIISVAIFIALASFINMAFDTVKDELKLTEYNLLLNINTSNNENFSTTYEEALKTTQLDNVLDYSVNRYSPFYLNKPNYSKDYLKWNDVDTKSDGFIEVVTIGNYQYQKYLKQLGLDYNQMLNKGILIDYNQKEIFNKKNNKKEEKYLRTYSYQKNDVIKGKNKDNQDFTFTIGSVTKIKPFGFNNYSQDILIVSDEWYDKFSSTNSVEIFYKSNEATTLQDTIEKNITGNYSLDNIEQDAKMMNNLFILVAIFLYGFIIVISLIGITNIFNTITTNMELRQKEFAMLKSIGMTKHEFKRMIRLETVFIGFKSLFYGIIIGTSLSYVIYYFLTKESNQPYNLPLLAIIISITAVFLLITMLMKYSLNKINKQNTIETIRNENI